MDSAFLALLFRMKHINRWGLMYNTQQENLSVHSFECAVLVHFLANIGNAYFSGSYNADKLAAFALFHDSTEVLTGDLPTPIKYFSSGLRASYEEIEKIAAASLLDHLPDELRPLYDKYINQSDLSSEEYVLMKAADRLCAYIKCIQELNAGNKEFDPAHHSAIASIKSLKCRELDYFLDNFLEAFSLGVHEIKGVLTNKGDEGNDEEKQ